jgi:hypothetical protein
MSVKYIKNWFMVHAVARHTREPILNWPFLTTCKKDARRAAGKLLRAHGVIHFEVTTIEFVPGFSL